ncbi:MAG: hypothetical protein KGJ72_08910 [Gammaproteobacteria bacterium]|nr:hypothetical protein [Gammaproteobacteria bacterium]
MAEAVYILCALTSILCAVLLLRGYRTTRTRLLFWASLCFVFLAINNVILYFDLVVLPPDIDLFWYRNTAAVAGIVVLIFGLTWDSR